MIARQVSKKRHQKNSNTLLQQESKKMQQKLQELKKQIQLKKSMKSSMNNTEGRFDKLKSKQINKFLNTASENMNKKGSVILRQSSNNNNNYNQLRMFYSGLKMEQYEEQLKKAGIKSKKELLDLKQNDIQKLPIPPGFRIKLKKAILSIQPNQKQKQNQKISINMAKNEQINHNTQQKQVDEKNQKMIDIELIVDRRNQQKQKNQLIKIPQNKFIQLRQQNQQDIFSLSNFDNGEYKRQQGYIIQDYIKNTDFLRQISKRKIKGQYIKTEKEYLKEYFDIQKNKIPMKSCISKKTQKRVKNKKRVHFNEETILKSEIPHKKYPKQGRQLKSRNESVRQRQQMQKESSKSGIQYCWQCCKRIEGSNKEIVRQKEKTYCGGRCLEKYMGHFLKRCGICEQRLKGVQQGQLRQVVCGRCVKEYKIEKVQDVLYLINALQNGKDSEQQIQQIDLSLF